MNKKRIIVSLITGIILGIFCIIGASLRFNMTLSAGALFALWYNRVLMGLVIGVISFNLTIGKRIIRGMILGLIVSFAFWSATGYSDHMSFIVGILYGAIIEVVAYKFDDKIKL